eukprot:SAG31_NODE_806_length_11957_cov_2.232670_10_plen_207_part_00
MGGLWRLAPIELLRLLLGRLDNDLSPKTDALQAADDANGNLTPGSPKLPLRRRFRSAGQTAVLAHEMQQGSTRKDHRQINKRATSKASGCVNRYFVRCCKKNGSTDQNSAANSTNTEAEVTLRDLAEANLQHLKSLDHPAALLEAAEDGDVDSAELWCSKPAILCDMLRSVPSQRLEVDQLVSMTDYSAKGDNHETAWVDISVRSD